MTLDSLFLDANILFSAAYSDDSGLRRLWSLEGVVLLTSDYALEEARRNLPDSTALGRLESLEDGLRIVRAVHQERDPHGSGLPLKDLPILNAAIAAECTHLLTGDITHFGPLLGRTLRGVLILRPAQYFRRKPRPPSS